MSGDLKGDYSGGRRESFGSPNINANIGHSITEKTAGLYREALRGGASKKNVARRRGGGP